jgi:L-alanine-DL-glutamate epimerase-like enolase superfamily enzyme
MMEATIHLACGPMREGPIEFMPWVAAAFAEPMRIEAGQMLAPTAPGLGLEIPNSVIADYRVG